MRSPGLRRDVIDVTTPRPPTRPSGHELLRRLARLAPVPMSVILGPDRTALVTAWRQALAWALRRHGWSYPRIAGALAVDHSTVIHAYRAVETTLSDYRAGALDPQHGYPAARLRAALSVAAALDGGDDGQS